MALSFFAGDTFEVYHFGCRDGRADEANEVKLRHIAAALIIFYKQLNILDILKFDVTQIDWISSQIFCINTVEVTGN